LNFVEDFYLLGHNAMYSAENLPKFRRNTSPPFSASSDYRMLHVGFFLGESSTLNKEAKCSSERFVEFQIHGIVSQKTGLFITTAVRT
jgi:hypothetical protein